MKLALFAPLPLALLPASAPADAVRFAPEAGAEVSKRLTEETAWTVRAARQTMAGQTSDAEFDAIGQELARTVAVADTYAEPAGGGDGGPAALVRRVGELAEDAAFALEAGGQELDFRTRSTSPLAGAELHFAWDAEGGRYRVTDADGEEVADAAGLLEDLDLRALLPAGDVEKDAEWKVAPEALAAVLRLGGDWKLEPESPAPGEYAPETVLPEDVLASTLMGLGAAWDSAGGEVLARYTGTEDGAARIELGVALELSGDLTDALARRIEASGLATDRGEIAFELEWTLEGTGELLWDVRASRFASFELALTGQGAARFEWLQPVGESSIELAVEAELDVESAFEARAEAR